MFRYLVSAVLSAYSLGVLSSAAGVSATDVSAWWSAATAAYGAASGYVASRTVIRIEELDAAGAVASYEEGETRLDWSKPGPAVVVVRAKKIGKDVSDDWRKRYAKAAKDSASGDDDSKRGPPAGFDATPFDPKYAKALKLGPPRADGSGFEVPYVITTDGGPVEGVARFSGSGVPVTATQSWTKPPAFVSTMSSSIRYARHEGALVVSGMDIEGEASVLFIKKRFRMRFEFSDWQKQAQ